MNLSYIKKQLQFWADKKDVLHVKELLTKGDQILVKRKSEELIQTSLRLINHGTWNVAKFLTS